MQKRKKRNEINDENNQGPNNNNIWDNLNNKNNYTTIQVKNEGQKNEEINNKYQLKNQI